MEIQLLFVDFRGSSHVVLEWLCFPRDDIAPGSVLRILSRVDLHVVSRLLLYHLLSFFLFTCSLFHFLWALRTCQVGHFDSHIFWFLIEFFIENLVSTGGRYNSNQFSKKFAWTLMVKMLSMKLRIFFLNKIAKIAETAMKK